MSTQWSSNSEFLSFTLLVRIGEAGQQVQKKIKSLSVQEKGAEQGWYQTSLSAFFDSQGKHTAMDSYILVQFTSSTTKIDSSIHILALKPSHRP